MPRRFCGFLIAFFLLAVLGAHVHAQKSQKLRITYASIGGQTLYLWVAQKEGIFRRHGIEAEIVYVPGSSAAVMALIAGDVQAAILGGQSIISANQNVIGALAEAVQRLKENQEMGLSYLAEMLRLDPKRHDHREAVEESLRPYLESMDRIPYLAPEGARTLIQQLSMQDPGWASLPIERLGVDMRLVQDLERSGFFQKLSAPSKKTVR